MNNLRTISVETRSNFRGKSILSIVGLMLTSFVLSSCVGTLTRKGIVKRDRYGEGIVVDMRDMVSSNEKLYGRKK